MIIKPQLFKIIDIRVHPLTGPIYKLSQPELELLLIRPIYDKPSYNHVVPGRG